MKLTAFALGLVAAANAQNPSLTSGTDGDLIVSRRQDVSVGALMTTVEALQLEVSALKAAATGSESPLMIGVNAVATDLTARTTNMIQQNAQLSAQVSSMDATISVQLAAQSTSVSAMIASTETDAESRATETDARINSAINSMNAMSISLNVSLRQTLSAQLDTSISRSTSSIVAMNSSLRAMMGSKKSNKVHMWSGGCANTGGSGWHDYCLNRVEVDTAAPYFRKQSNTRFISIQAMVMQIDFYCLKRSNSWTHNLIYIDGTHRTHTHSYRWDPWQNYHWLDDQTAITYPIAANKQFYGRAYASAWNAWHATQYHSRITVTHKGTRD